MTEIGVSKFIAKFDDEGLDEPEFYPDLTDEELKHCGFKIGHFKKWRRKYPLVCILFWFYMTFVQGRKKGYIFRLKSSKNILPIKYHNFLSLTTSDSS